MPEFFNYRMIELTRAARKVDFFGRTRVPKKYGLQYVDDGAARIVVSPSKQSKVVFASDFITETTWNRVQGLYYAHRILHTLFPNNFPIIHTSFNSKKYNISGTVRQKIRPQFFHKKAKYPFEAVEEITTALGLPISFDHASWRNFMVGRNGGEYYLDTVCLYHNSSTYRWDMRKIIAWMHQNEYSQSDCRIVEKSIKRLHIMNSPHKSAHPRTHR